jgi:NapH/MauN family ferredoxin-type protein
MVVKIMNKQLTIQKIKTKLSLRFIMQFVIVAVVFTLAIMHQQFGIEKAAPIDAYCPFGAVESFFTLLFKGEFLQRIFTSSFVLLGIFFIGTLFLGKVFCSYFCPLGAIQEWLRLLGKKIGFKKDIEFPENVDKYLRYLKYVVLLVVVYFSFYLGDLIFRNYDPYNALMHLGQEFDEKVIAYMILVVVVISSFFSKSLWCRYLCPLGAFFGVIKEISFLKIKRDSNSCVNCGLCNSNCPANLKIKTADEIKSADCISCGKCINHCPKNSLQYAVFGKKISKVMFSALLIVLVVLPLIIASLTPFWKTKPESNIINVRGEINTEDIRGSNTLKYVIETTKVPLSEFQEKLNLPANVDISKKLKEIGALYNITNKDGGIIKTEDFRLIIDEYIKNKKTEIGQDCPFGKTNDEFPGDCGRYIDDNQDNICDHSQ